MASRVLIVETIHIRHKKQEISMDHSCCDCREGIIVTEFDFRNSQGVVFIDDWDDTHVQQGIEGVLGIEVSRPLEYPCQLCRG